MKRLVFYIVLSMLFILPFAIQAQSVPTVYDPSVCAYEPGQPHSDECLAMMEAFPEPDFEFITPDYTTISTYSFWRVGPDATPTFDAPGGNVIGQIAAGFNFVSAIDLSVEGWLQIQGGAWIQRDIARYAEASNHVGVQLPEDWEHPFAWVLDTTGIYSSLEPGGESSAESGYLTQRYDMVNIFAEAYDDEGWRWYLVGPNQWVKQTFVSKVQSVERPEDENGDLIEGRWVGADLFEQTLIAYDNDTPVFATLIASGLPGTETNEGLFEVWARLEVDGMSGATGAPNAYDLQSVPWVMYFDNDISLHGTYWHDLFGYRQSRGCVNLTISDARFIFQWFLGGEANTDGEILNHVYVFHSEDFRPANS